MAVLGPAAFGAAQQRQIQSRTENLPQAEKCLPNVTQVPWAKKEEQLIAQTPLQSKIQGLLKLHTGRFAIPVEPEHSSGQEQGALGQVIG